MRERVGRLVWTLKAGARNVRGGVPFNQRDRREAAVLGGVCVVVVAVLVPVLLLGRGRGDSDPESSTATLTVIDPVAETRARATADFVAIDDSDDLERGAEIRTDDQGFVELEYADGSRTRFGPSTLASIDRLDDASVPKRIAVGLDIGRALQRPATTGGAPAIMELRTETAVASAKDAEFTAECETSSVCRFIVIRGTVDVAPSDADAVRLSENDTVTVDHGALVDQRRLNDLEIAAYPWIAFNRSYDGSTVPPPATSAPSGSLLVATDVPAVPELGRLPASALKGKLPDISKQGTPIMLPTIDTPIGSGGDGGGGGEPTGPIGTDPTTAPTPGGPEPTVTTKNPNVTSTTKAPNVTTTTKKPKVTTTTTVPNVTTTTATTVPPTSTTEPPTTSTEPPPEST